MLYTSYYEREIVHPTTACWLQDRGYEYEHEPFLQGEWNGQPFSGAPDFLAWHENYDCMLIVDCKADAKLQNVVYQMERYAKALGEPATTLIALPKECLTAKNNKWFARHGIWFLGLDMPISKADYERHGQMALFNPPPRPLSVCAGRLHMIA